jgi:hypothetical protein
MSDIFKRYVGRGETGVSPSPYLAIAPKGTTAISQVDIELLITSGYLSIDTHKIFGIGDFPSRTGYHPEKDLMREFGEFRHQIIEKLDTIYARLSDLEKKIESFSPITQVSVIEEISKDEAKKRISECLSEIDEKIYPSEIAKRLHVDYDLCVEIIEELLGEGKIEIVEE